MKKSGFLFVGLFTIILLALSSCEISECKNCEVVTYDAISGTEISRQAAIEYCGEALDDVENTPDQINGNTRTVWECY